MKGGGSRQLTENAVFSLLEQGLTELALPYTQKQLEQLAELVGLLDHWASRINLTGHTGPLEMASRLILDAAALVACLPEISESKTLADLGSGAGFPGLPIAILNSQVNVLLVDSRLKRHHFQREARRRLELENVATILGRSNEIEQVPCDIVIAQAMTQPRQALTMMAQWSHAGSILVLPASETASRPPCPDGFQDLLLREYRVPHTGTLRRLWIAQGAEK